MPLYNASENRVNLLIFLKYYKVVLKRYTWIILLYWGWKRIYLLKRCVAPNEHYAQNLFWKFNSKSKSTPNPGIQFFKNIFEVVSVIMKINYRIRLLQLCNIPCRLVLSTFLLNGAKLILKFMFIAIALFFYESSFIRARVLDPTRI